MSLDPIPVRLTPDLQGRLDRLCEHLSLSRSAILRLAIRQWLDATEAHGINPMLNDSSRSAPATTPTPPAESPAPAYPAKKAAAKTAKKTPRKKP